MTKYFLQAIFALLIFSNLSFAAPRAAIRLSFDPPTLDWNLGDVPIHVMNNVMEGLYAIDQNGKVVPAEAQALPRKSGKRAYSVKLRTGLKWSDGRAVTAADYVYSWSRLRDPKTASTYPYLLNDIESARAIGATEIEIKMKSDKKPLRAAVFSHWATFPLRADLVEKHGSKWAEPQHMVFNGRYKIASYKSGEKLVLVPNSAHRQPGVFERIDALIVTDDATALRLYDSGRLDFMSDLGALDRKQFEQRPDYHSMRSPVLVYVGANTQAPLVKLPSPRIALSQAIDRTAMIKALGAAHVATTMLVPGQQIDHGVNGSPKLAGQSLVFGYFEKGSNRTLAEFLQAEWKTRLKLNVQLEPTEIKTYWSKLAKSAPPLFLNSFGPPVWDERYYFDLLRSNNPMNMGRWSNAAYDRALDAGDYRHARQIFTEEMPIVPLYFRAYEYLLSPKLKGQAKLNPMTSLYLN